MLMDQKLSLVYSSNEATTQNRRVTGIKVYDGLVEISDIASE
jgi:hypothetical protein